MGKSSLGIVKKGKFNPYNADAFRRSFWEFEGKEVSVSVGVPKKGRSQKQNRYLWAVVYKMIGDHIGEHVDTVHKLMGYKFLRRQGDHGCYVESTTKLTTVEQEDYHSQLRIWAAEFLHLYIPEPNEIQY